MLSAISVRTTGDADLVEILLRLREAGAEVVTINTFPATKKGEPGRHARLRHRAARPRRGRGRGASPRRCPASTSPRPGRRSARSSASASSSSAAAPRWRRWRSAPSPRATATTCAASASRVDTIALVGEENIAAAVRAVADLPRAHILVLAGSHHGRRDHEGRARAARDRHPGGLAEHGRLRRRPRPTSSSATRSRPARWPSWPSPTRPASTSTSSAAAATSAADRQPPSRGPGAARSTESLARIRPRHAPRAVAADLARSGRSASVARPGPLLRARLGPRRGPPALRQRTAAATSTSPTASPSPSWATPTRA